VGDIDYETINKSFTELLEKLKGRSIKDYRLVLAREKKGYKDEKDRIPEGIKASQKFLEGEEDWALIQKNIDARNIIISAIDKKITDKSAVLTGYNETLKLNAEKIKVLDQEKQVFVNNWSQTTRDEKTKLNTEILKIQADQGILKHQTETAKRAIETNESSLSDTYEKISDLIAKRDDAKKAHGELNKTEFKEPEDGKCGSCGHDIVLSYDEIEELRSKFNLDKANKLELIVSKNNPLIKDSGLAEKEVEKLKKEHDDQELGLVELATNKRHLDKKLEEIKKEHDEIDITVLEDEAKHLPEYVCKDVEIEKLTSQEMPSIDVSEFTKEKQAVQIEIDGLRETLNKKSTIDQANENIATYEARFKELAQKIVSLEGIEFQTEKYEKALIGDLEMKVNELFNGIKFKMFETQINGGIKPTCVILVNGVPYDSANTASRIQSGIQIINVLSAHYNVTAPILIDNRESVIEIPETKSQIFNMKVVENQKLKFS
jgi:hypothetical protein